MSPSRESTTKLRFAARLVAVNLGLLAVGVSALELSFGRWFEPDPLVLLDIKRSYVRRYDVSHLYRAPEAITNVRGRYGFRGAYPNPGAIDVLTIGGSTTEQKYVTEGSTWQDVIRRRFQAEGLDVSVVNAGQSGQSTHGHLKCFEWWFPSVPGLEMRYTLLYVGINDLYVEPEGDYDVLREPHEFKHVLEGRSALYRAWRLVRGTYRARFVAKVGHRPLDFTQVDWVDRPRLGDHAEVIREVLAAYEKRLGLLLARIKQWPSTPVCVTQQTRFYRRNGGSIEGAEYGGSFAGREINGVDLYHLLSLLNEKTIEVCRGSGAPAIDLASELELDDADFYDYVHNTPSGTRKIGRYLHAKLRPLFASEAVGAEPAAPPFADGGAVRD